MNNFARASRHGGFNISPRSVEEVILNHPGVEQVAVIGIPHDFYGEEVAAVIKFKMGRNLSSERSPLEVLCKCELNS